MGSQIRAGLTSSLTLQRMTSTREGDILILCPMEIERRAVALELRSAKVTAHVARTGIGSHAILPSVERAAAAPRKPRLVILAGACGGLRPVEDVPPIARVIDEQGREWCGLGMSPIGRTLVGVDRIVASPEDKRALADRTGAALVDMESHAFAAACERLGLAWSVVRGVSDSPEESLPPEVLNWIRPDGTTRSARALADLLLHPRLIPHVIAVLKRSRRVLPLVGKRVVEVVRTFQDRGRTIDS